MPNNRVKGKAGEREAVQLWKSIGYADARRGMQFRDGSENADVIGVPYWVEIKRYKQVSPAVWAKAWNQATKANQEAFKKQYAMLADCIVMARSDRDGWSVLTTVELLHRLGYQGENHYFQHPQLVGGADLRKVPWQEFAALVRKEKP